MDILSLIGVRKGFPLEDWGRASQWWCYKGCGIYYEIIYSYEPGARTWVYYDFEGGVSIDMYLFPWQAN